MISQHDLKTLNIIRTGSLHDLEDAGREELQRIEHAFEQARQSLAGEEVSLPLPGEALGDCFFRFRILTIAVQERGEAEQAKDYKPVTSGVHPMAQIITVTFAFRQMGVRVQRYVEDSRLVLTTAVLQRTAEQVAKKSSKDGETIH
jgi:hypothetical protein